MQVAVGITGAVIVDDNVHTLDVDTTTEDIRCNKDTLFECLEGGVAVDTVGNIKRLDFRQ